jgi:hypothetical protein
MNIDLEPTTFCDKHIMCPNGCYEEIHGQNMIDIYIFEKKLKIEKNKLLMSGVEFADEIQKTIDYWKANERYLVKLLEGYVSVSHKPKSIIFHEQIGMAVINKNAIASIKMT